MPGRSDEFESTQIIGDRQFRKALDLFNTASEELKGKVEYRHTFIDFSKLEVTLGTQEVVKTCPAAMGFGFAAGTTDGPGAFDFKQGDDKVTEVLTLNLMKRTQINKNFFVLEYQLGLVTEKCCTAFLLMAYQTFACFGAPYQCT